MDIFIWVIKSAATLGIFFINSLIQGYRRPHLDKGYEAGDINGFVYMMILLAIWI